MALLKGSVQADPCPIHLMIVLSDNTATNILIECLGTARVNARLDSFGLRDTRLFRPTFRDGRADVLPELAILQIRTRNAGLPHG
jgi:hypothetical protein